MGITPIGAAIAGGVLPQGWEPGQPTPWDRKGTSTGFNQPSGKDASTSKAEGPEGKADGQGKQEANAAPDYLARKSAVEAASQALQQADRIVGGAVVDGLMNSTVESGELPDLDTLPEGVSEEAVQRVVAGYVAQANDKLAAIKTSVGGLEATLTDHELRRARQAVVAGDTQQLLELGHLSLNRLEQMPSKDPEGFGHLIEGMREQERKAVRYDEQRREWTIKHPVYGEIGFGAAVRLGVVYFD
ncbi:MAG: hypothetical protein Q4G14_05910 [Paracoccus sp. (in: a-proteobacteria)]|nr:hypothetical protein [Paracoccus sp. (in: a-proteobacteria)]